MKYTITDPRWPDRNWPCHDAGMKMYFGLTSADKWPKEGLPARNISGVEVFVKPLDPNRRSARQHRARALCPHCGLEFSAGRINYHIPFCKQADNG